MTEPARVNGSHRRAMVLFIEDKQGDLVDLAYFCRDCAMETRERQWDAALDWPAFDFGDGPVYCAACSELIDRRSDD